MQQTTSKPASRFRIVIVVLVSVAVIALAVCIVYREVWSREEILWEIPFQTSEADALTFIESYGEWQYPFGLESFTTDGEMLFIDDSVNSRIQVWSKNGREQDIQLPQDVACRNMRFVSEENSLYIVAYNKTWVEPVDMYYVVHLEQGTELTLLEELPYGNWLDEKGVLISKPTIYYEEAQSHKSAIGLELVGANAKGWFTITEKAGEVYFGEAGVLNTDIVVPFLYSQGELTLDTEVIYDTAELQSANQYTFTLYESKGKYYLVYMRRLDDDMLGICRRRFEL